MKWWKFYLSDNRFEVRDKTVRSSERCYVGELEGANKFDSITLRYSREGVVCWPSYQNLSKNG